MKLTRFGNVGNEKPAVVIDNIRYDVSGFGQDFTEDFFGNDGINKLKVWVATNKSSLPVVDNAERWASCIARPSKIICIGLNYADHAAESNMALPKEPIIFFKSTTALVGPNDDLVIPKGSEKTDWVCDINVDRPAFFQSHFCFSFRKSTHLGATDCKTRPCDRTNPRLSIYQLFISFCF